MLDCLVDSFLDAVRPQVQLVSGLCLPIYNPVWEVRVPDFRIKTLMGQTDTGLFSEKYRVVAVEAERLTIKGIITGKVLTIINSNAGSPLTAEQYPLGKLIALSDPSAFAAS